MSGIILYFRDYDLIFSTNLLKKYLSNKYGKIFHNKITETKHNGKCWKKGSKDRTKTFKCKLSSINFIGSRHKKLIKIIIIIDNNRKFYVIIK